MEAFERQECQAVILCEKKQHVNVKTSAVFKVGILQCITVIVLFYSQISALLFLFLYCNFINTLYKWGGGKWEGGGGKQSFTLINRRVKKVLIQRKGGSKKFLNLNTMSRVLISIITNGKKEDSENAISKDLETQNCSVPTMVVPRGSGAH